MTVFRQLSDRFLKFKGPTLSKSTQILFFSHERSFRTVVKFPVPEGSIMPSSKPTIKEKLKKFYLIFLYNTLQYSMFKFKENSSFLDSVARAY